MSRALLALGVALLAGCSTQQWYLAGQSLQRASCDRLLDTEARSRCLAQSSMSYDAYRREAERAR